MLWLVGFCVCLCVHKCLHVLVGSCVCLRVHKCLHVYVQSSHGDAMLPQCSPYAQMHSHKSANHQHATRIGENRSVKQKQTCIRRNNTMVTRSKAREEKCHKHTRNCTQAYKHAHTRKNKNTRKYTSTSTRTHAHANAKHARTELCQLHACKRLHPRTRKTQAYKHKHAHTKNIKHTRTSTSTHSCIPTDSTNNVPKVIKRVSVY